MSTIAKKIISFLFSGLSILLALSLLFTGCKKEELEPIKIGFIGVITGMYSTTGIRGRDAVILAVEQLNEQGGINGRQIELFIKDDKNDPDTAVKSFQELTEEGVVAIIGHTNSTNTMALLPHLNKTDILMLGDAGSSLFSGQDDRYFRVVTATDQVGASLAELAANHLKLKKIGAIYDIANAGYTEVLYNSFKSSFEELGGEMLPALTFDSRETVSIPELVEQLGDIDGFFVLGSANHMAIISQHVRNRDDSIEIIVPYITLEYLETGGPQVERVYSFTAYDKNITNDKIESLKAAYRDRFSQDLSRTSQELYEVMEILFEVLEKTEEGGDLKDTLLKQRVFEGLSGKLIFDEYGEMYRTKYIITVKDGKEVNIGTIEPDIAGN